MTFTSPLAQELAPGMLERFLRYVQVDTQARAPRTGSPSSPGQLELGRILVAELQQLGLDDAAIDGNGYVTATVPATNGASAVIGLLAHMDTSPDAPGAGVTPLVHRDYDGGVIELPRAGTRLDPAAMPELQDKRGHDIVTSSGDTLLGADDKAGIAAIMAAADYLLAHPDRPRPTLRIGFTVDEEIGEGGKLFDIPAFGAQAAYTIDGSSLGEIQDETFSALAARVTVTGHDVHPGHATGKLVSALRLIGKIVAELPADRAPETTAGREGFIHPTRVAGTAAKAELELILRAFDEEELEGYAALVERIAHQVVDAAPPAAVQVEVRRQYTNMRRFLDAVPEVTEHALEALRAEGIEPIREPIRGGTDGSLLSERGLPTPNIFDGGHEYHSVREWASVQEMAAAAATIVHLAGQWAKVA